MQAQESWVLMKDGTYASPADLVRDDDGVTRHKETGMEVAVNEHGEQQTLGEVTRLNRESTNASKRAADHPTAGNSTPQSRPEGNVDMPTKSPDEAAKAAQLRDMKQSGEAAKPYVTRESKAE